MSVMPHLQSQEINENPPYVFDTNQARKESDYF